MPKSDVLIAINQLTTQLETAKKIPFSDSVVLNQSTTLETLKRIVTSYDPSLENAEKIIANEESIIKEATDQANASLEKAVAQAQGMTNEANAYAQKTRTAADTYQQNTKLQAEETARAIMADAQARARQMIEDAKAHADELVSQTTVLARAEAQAQEILANANQHAAAMHKQVQSDLNNLLDQVGRVYTDQLNTVRGMQQNILAMQSYGEDGMIE